MRLVPPWSSRPPKLAWWALAVVISLAGCLGTPAGSDAGRGPSSDSGTDGGLTEPGDAGPLPPDDGGSLPMDSGTPPPDAGSLPTDAGCLEITSTGVSLGAAGTAGEYVLELDARAESHTRWDTAGNEALVLEVTAGTRRLSHVVLHQGADGFVYHVPLGALAATDAPRVKVSSLSAATATQKACVTAAHLYPASHYGTLAEAITHAPIFLWPVAKRFDDLPVVLGWSAQQKHYEYLLTNENGGTAVICGGGATGMRSEIARWGRGSDLEGIYNYGSSPTWKRCISGVIAVTATVPRMDGTHPVFYYGDGHNSLYESRGGYGNGCGTAADQEADGNLSGWNTGNPGNAATEDAPFTVMVRPWVTELDPFGFATDNGRREALMDANPWVYRLTDHELHREGKVDGSLVRPLDHYLYLDLEVDNVNGSGDPTCGSASLGFSVSTKTADAVVSPGPRLTSTSVPSGVNTKRMAIPLAQAYAPTDFSSFTFTAYDNDGIYLLRYGDAFVVRAVGDNGAQILSRHSVSTPVNVYVDADSSGCTGGFNTAGPGGLSYPCVGATKTFAATP